MDGELDIEVTGDNVAALKGALAKLSRTSDEELMGDDQSGGSSAPDTSRGDGAR